MEIEQLHIEQNKFKRWLFISLGIICVGLGTLGIFIPLLPTTVFYLVAAWAFSKSSKRLHQWIFNNKYFGTYLKNYLHHKGITKRSKTKSITLLWLTLACSMFFIKNIFVILLLFIIGIGVTWHLFTLKIMEEK